MSAAAAARPLLHCIIQATTFTLNSSVSSGNAPDTKFSTPGDRDRTEIQNPDVVDGHRNPRVGEQFNQFHSRSRDKVHTHTILKISKQVEFNTRMERMIKRKLNSRPLRCPPIFPPLWTITIALLSCARLCAPPS